MFRLLPDYEIKLFDEQAHENHPDDADQTALDTILSTACARVTGSTTSGIRKFSVVSI